MKNLCVICAVSLLVLLVVRDAETCSPGRGAGRRRRPYKLTPLVFKQHIPGVGENNAGASGSPEKRGPIRRGDKRFKDLVANWNQNIIFKDEEKTQSDRMMSRRLREKLDDLAVSVRNQWPDLKLRVTEAWDEDNQHAEDSLHYQGRAADITTSDRDQSKYGMLARLAVEAGFDWVYYESRGHIHCSVKSDDSAALRHGGCFPSHSTVVTPTGRKSMSALRIGDLVQVVTDSGLVSFSPILLFLDRETRTNTSYLNVLTSEGRVLSLTPAHLIFVKTTRSGSEVKASKFASELRVGDVVQTVKGERLVEDTVARITQSVEQGLYAPLTAEGNLIVDETLVSCYAVISSHQLAHRTLAPLRWLYTDRQTVARLGGPDIPQPQQGMHWYTQMLYQIAQYVLPTNMLYKT